MSQFPTKSKVGRLVLTVVGAAVGFAILSALVERWAVYQRAAQIAEEEPFRLIAEIPPAHGSFAPQRAVPRQRVVTGFQVVSAGEAATVLDDDELVLAVVIDGAARAYPINVMTGPTREIFNDTLGGRSITATW